MTTTIAAGQPLTSGGVTESLEALGVDRATIWAVIGVETSGCGFLADRRPKILYERHLFHRLTGGAFDDGDISSAEPGGYGRGGAAQYDRLARAIELDREAALMSASWGLGQVLGANFSASGFADVEEMVRQMAASEDRQLLAMSSFIVTNGMDGFLRRLDWTAFAKAYNGPAFKKNRYDDRLRAEHLKCTSGLVPDLDVRSVQLYLTYLGFHPGPVDGVAGALTRSAIREFQRCDGLPLTGDVDATLIARLTIALPPPSTPMP